MLALLGELIFEPLTSPDAFRLASAYRYAEHEVVEAPARLQWLANELQKLSLGLSFHVAFTNPKTQMDNLRAAAEDHQARALIFGNGIHRGYFVIESLEEIHHQLADDGSFIAISARVELREWVPGADFDPLAPPRRTTPPPGIVQASPSSTTTGGSATNTSTGGGGSAAAPSVFNPNQPIGPHNLLPTSAIVQLSNAGTGQGVTYSPLPYSQPGVSGVAGSGPPAQRPGNPGDVTASSIVRAG
jgi:phage protein U